MDRSQIIGNNIFSVLEKRGISIRRMGIDLDMDYSYVYNLVHKESLATVQLSTVVRVAEYLGVNIEDLYWEKERGKKI